MIYDKWVTVFVSYDRKLFFGRFEMIPVTREHITVDEFVTGDGIHHYLDGINYLRRGLGRGGNDVVDGRKDQYRVGTV